MFPIHKIASTRKSRRSEGIFFFTCFITVIAAIFSPSVEAVDVTTYHYDLGRTGLNNVETVLTPATVASSSFTKVATATFTGHVDAQPLVVSAATWASWGRASSFPHDVAYIVTSNNDLFAIDGVSGKILLQRNFGTPVSQSSLPIACNNNYTTVGITSTPVIDSANRVMFLVSYTSENGALVYRLHKINLADLTDNAPNVVVSASASLSDGTLNNFQAAYQRQRVGLVLSQGNVYAGFAGFCDSASNYARGWILGWNAASLNPLKATLLTNQETTTQNGGGLNIGWTTVDFLSTIWMTGAAPAVDSAGNLYANTGNSSAHNVNNFPDSTLKVSSDLSTVLDYFTPSNFSYLDANDLDMGASGVLVVPDMANGVQLAASSSKDGRFWLFNRNNLGKYIANGSDVPKSIQLTGCWCGGPSYFVGGDTQPRLISTHGTQARTWLLPITSAGSLTAEATGVALPTDGSQNPGFMASVSSNGTAVNSAVIWAASRTNNGRVFLQAIDATSGAGGGSVTDIAGNVWTFGTAERAPGEHSLLMNGATVGGWAVKVVIANNGAAYGLNASGQWSYFSGGTTWTQSAPPNARAPSPAGSSITAPSVGGTSATLTDGLGNTWSFGALTASGGNNVMVNGIATNGQFGNWTSTGQFATKIVIAGNGSAWLGNAQGKWLATGNGTNTVTQASAPVVFNSSAVGSTIVPGSGGSITEAAGNVWSFGAQVPNGGGNYYAVLNGVNTYGWAAKIAMGSNGSAFVQAASGQWYSPTLVKSVAGWSAVATPTTATSIVPTSSPSVSDGSGNLWSFGAAVGNGNYYAMFNGNNTGGWVQKIGIGTNGRAYVYAAAGQWYAPNVATSVSPGWAPVAAPSLVASIAQTSAAAVTDAMGNIWSIGPAIANSGGNYSVMLNGTNTHGWAAKIGVGNDGNPYVSAASGLWYNPKVVTSVASWVAVKTPVQVAASIGSYATPSGASELRELQLVDSGGWLTNTNNATNVNAVPVVANGQVYLATTNALTIWGLR